MAIEGTVTPPPTATPAAPEGKPTGKPAEAPAGAAAAPVAPTSVPGTPEAQKPSEDTQKDSARFAALTKKEAALRKRQEAIKVEQDALAAQKAELDAFRQEKELAKRNPEAIAKQLWGDSWYEQLTEFKLNGGKVTPELVAAHIDAKVEGLKKQIEQEKADALKKEQEQIRTQQQQLVQTWQEEVEGYVQQNSNLYELITGFESAYLVHQYMTKVFNESGKLIETKEAADFVENYLEQQVKKTAKFSAKAAPQPQGDLKRTEVGQPRQTISNDLTASTAATKKPRTEAERWQAAMAAFERGSN